MNADIGTRIKNLRENMDLKQTQIASLLHISQQNYSRYENGQREMPISILVGLAELFDVSVDYLVGVSMTKKDLSAIGSRTVCGHSLKDTINDMVLLDDERLRTVIDYVDFIKDR